MKERPISFSGEMVRAILEGRKTQTRRVMNPQPYDEWYPFHYGEIHGIVNGYPDPDKVIGWGACTDEVDSGYVCKYGRPGDRLWVKETFLYDTFMDDADPDTPDIQNGLHRKRLVYRASYPDYPLTAGSSVWTRSIFMPRWASRITMEILSIRAERVQDISEEDALAEGVGDWMTDDTEEHYYAVEKGKTPCADTAIEVYKMLWDSIYAKRGFSWNANPRVWVIEFSHLKEVTT